MKEQWVMAYALQLRLSDHTEVGIVTCMATSQYEASGMAVELLKRSYTQHYPPTISIPQRLSELPGLIRDVNGSQ